MLYRSYSETLRQVLSLTVDQSAAVVVLCLTLVNLSWDVFAPVCGKASDMFWLTGHDFSKTASLAVDICMWKAAVV